MRREMKGHVYGTDNILILDVHMCSFYKKSLKILKKVSLKLTITVNTEWEGEIFVTF